MNKILKYSIACLFFLSALTLKAEDTLWNVLRPRIGMGTGVMTYYGEIQNYQKQFVPTVNRYGGLLYVNAPITKFLNLEFSATYAKIAANERSLRRNFNFESRIRMGSAYLYYNFYPFFKEERGFFHPFIGVGFSSFEFLSKSDIYNRHGEMYHYWSDGSIRNLAEDDPNAATAKLIERDYTYETDLRAQDYDGLGKYREQSFAFPMTAGVEFHLSPRWDFRISTVYNQTFTDLIDNLSPAGTGLREGDKKKDKLLFTYFSLSYDLQFSKKTEEQMEEDEDIPLFADWDQNDWDKDGVIDALDQCPGTPLEAIVDENGCPKDGDGDGVPDYLDEELNTPEGNFVDKFGVTLSEEQIARHWELYNDSTGYAHDFTELRTKVTFGKDNDTKGELPSTVEGRSYVVIIGKEKKGVQANELHKYLGFTEYETVIKGDTVYYILGEYQKIEDAVAAKKGLEESGVEVDEIGKNNLESGNVTAVSDEVLEKVEKINAAEGKEIPEYGTDSKVFRVQVGAFKNKVDLEKHSFRKIDDLVYGTGSDGITRYYSGKFDNYDDAEVYRKQMVAKGYKSAFVVAYEAEERKLLNEVVSEDKLPNNYDPDKELSTFVEPHHSTTDNATNNTSGVDMSKAKYRIQLGQYSGDVPTEVLSVLQQIGGVKPVKAFDGSTTYYSRQFNSKEERDAAMKEYEVYELEGMSEIIEYEGKYYTPEEFKKLQE